MIGLPHVSLLRHEEGKAMFERYTEPARRAIFFAHYEATYQPATAISTAHILLGLTREVGSRADELGSLKSDETRIRSELGIPKPPKTAGKLPLAGSIPLNNNSKMLLAYAAQEADKDDSCSIDTDHLLRGLLRFPNEATGALSSISLDLATAQTLSRRNRAEFPEKKTLYVRLFGAPFRTHRPALLRLLALVVVLFLGAFLIHSLVY
jgi:ATP-dependent Clp protease ATP-binding subunit ClpC